MSESKWERNVSSQRMFSDEELDRLIPGWQQEAKEMAESCEWSEDYARHVLEMHACGIAENEKDFERFSAIDDEVHRQWLLHMTQKVESVPFLEVDDDSSVHGNLSVLDRRTTLCVTIERPEQIKELIEKGAERYLNEYGRK